MNRRSFFALALGAALAHKLGLPREPPVLYLTLKGSPLPAVVEKARQLGTTRTRKFEWLTQEEFRRRPYTVIYTREQTFPLK